MLSKSVLKDANSAANFLVWIMHTFPANKQVLRNASRKGAKRRDVEEHKQILQKFPSLI
ncbi:hypothetical protein COCNU_contig68091506G000010 [Cocos nucifera]|nr:hypothetical protein [Cocos nucifera]